MDKQEAETVLRKVLKDGATVYAILKHVSQSGTTRHIQVLAVRIVTGKPASPTVNP